MRVVYFGSGAFGLPTLERLADHHDVALVVTQPDRPAGRRRVFTGTPIAQFADERNIAVLKPTRINELEIVQRIRSLNADAFVVIAYGLKLGEPLLAGAFAINLHGSLLPKYRGAAPINWAVINGERETGLSVITLAQRMDAGAILASRATAIDPMETAGEVHDRLAELGPDLVLTTLQRHLRGDLEPIEQDESQATDAPKLTKADGTVSFDRPAEAVRCRVHGLTPWPGCTVILDESPLKLLRVESLPRDGGASPEPGTLRDNGCVTCGEGMVRLLTVQPPGGRAMDFSAFRRGHDIGPGARLRPL